MNFAILNSLFFKRPSADELPGAKDRPLEVVRKLCSDLPKAENRETKANIAGGVLVNFYHGESGLMLSHPHLLYQKDHIILTN